MATAKVGTRCRRCGADAFGASGSGRPYLYRRLRIDAKDSASCVTVLHLCAPCNEGFASDRERNEYLESGLLL